MPFLERFLITSINYIANSQEGRVRFGLFSNSMNIKRVTYPEKGIDLQMFGLFFLIMFFSHDINGTIGFVFANDATNNELISKIY